VGHREDLLAAARRCLEERGYARTTARDLVAASGTNLASIGYHFGSKEALLNEAISASFAEWAERVRILAMAALPAEVDHDDPLQLLLTSWGAIRASFEEYRGLAVAFTEALAQAERQPELRTQLAEAYQRCRDQVAEMIVDAIGEKDRERARVIASFEIAVCDGLLVQWLLDPQATPGAEELTEALASVLTRPGRPDHPSQ
jgi:AcrR family transcriptional regulator